MSYTFKDLAYNILESAEKPLTVTEIWDLAEKRGLVTELAPSGKTPTRTLSAMLYMDIRANNESKFSQVSKSPPLFTLKDKQFSEETVQEVREAHYSSPILDSSCENKETKKNKESHDSIKERNLHQLLTYFVSSHPHFECFTKTIFHENSKKEKAGKNLWLHPDIVGVRYPHNDYKNETLRLRKELKEKSTKLFSFELKLKLTLADVRQYYFQAVSNSSWANEAYLVALNTEDKDVREELQSLNRSFGVGVILLKPDDLEGSEILCFAHINSQIDYEAIDRLVELNKVFKTFINDIVVDSESYYNVYRGSYDIVLSIEDIKEHCEKSGFLTVS